MMLYDRFAASVAHHGDRTAIEVGGERVSYRQLAELAEGLAARIQHEHPDLSGRIGLLAERNLFAYVGYLAIQRLGKSVVPINPAFPESRKQYMLTASGADLVLTEDRAGPGAALPPLIDDPETEAYLLFTSGSTGTPKGVPISQGNAAAFLDRVQDRYGLGPGARCSQSFDLTFDLSVFDLFAVWSSGATLVVPSRNDLLRPVRFIADNALTHWFSVPSVISKAQAGGRLPANSLPSLRYSLFAGEALTWQQARAWKAAAPESVLANLYGPTELTIACTDFVLPADPGDWPVAPNGGVPIGLPYPGLEHAVLDESGQPVAEGELCVRGPQRFAGYLDPQANQGRFHPEPGPATVPGDHWYRTGDRVNTRDGILNFLGRDDQQVKVSGYRVELGEIEAALRRINGVADAIVVAVEDNDGALGLYGVCLAPAADPIRLRAELVGSLPGYLVPRRVLTVEQLPCNSNGKVDRRAIAELVRTAIQRPVAVAGERSRT